ncbi:helix-turn-helix domain-containing protein [Youxingia wuxianensis]|nr:helix-turn-helix transcriptional regulator [Youxingia wuxianensis]
MIYNLSARLKQLRQEKHLKQEQVALLVGVTKSAVSAWELDMRQPSYEALIRLAELYRVSTDYLLGRTYSRSIDLTGLTNAEIALICELVASMKAKNQKLEEFI